MFRAFAKYVFPFHQNVRVCQRSAGPSYISGILFIPKDTLSLCLEVFSRLIERCVQDNEDAAKLLLHQLDDALNLKTTAVWKFILRFIYQFFLFY